MSDEPGHLAAIGPCFGCKRRFAFDPDTVNSIPIDPDNGLPPDMGGDPAKAVKQPVCPDCIEAANAQRRKDGRPQVTVNLPPWSTR